ncbi:preprotein translocase subunit SecG [Candidatus Oleimmundimicrobium sp.]|uniref:preprotein translocase subunit SecG n=1 Tax=Candidatus Oleimmundimicrobium sp. TaxID=3060597 RepID=UPI00271D54C6|nr:preprotein translocase subunit SecG [Candidatus Oleimmundimicrobium sp.]MDO8885651.1 preprotein translocase subunit SecG [Candidatus Oleimmundimicrobium sp.]
MSLLLAKVPVIMMLVGVVWFIAALFLILLILIQKGKGGGLGAAFGGAGSNSLLGTKTGDFLTWVTIGLTVVFLTVGVLMAKFYRPTELKGLQDAVDTTAVDTSALLEENTTMPEEPAQEAAPQAETTE